MHDEDIANALQDDFSSPHTHTHRRVSALSVKLHLRDGRTD